jgi:folate-dependent phosphoribosylglycinamide formyltransferase PurN
MRVTVLGTRSEASFAVCNYLNQHHPNCTFVFEEPVSAQQLIKRRIKNLGVFHVAGQLAFQVLVSPLLRRASASRIGDIQRQYGIRTSAPNKAASCDVSSVNAPETLDLLNRLAPEVIVLAGTRIVGKKLLASLTCPVLNIHAGITPLYRGVHGAYWALAEGRPNLCGVTVHRVDAGIDTGAVLAQTLIHPTKEDNFASYPWLQMGEGLSLLAALLPRIAAHEDVSFVPLASESKLRHHPTIWEYFLRRVR